MKPLLAASLMAVESVLVAPFAYGAGSGPNYALTATDIWIEIQSLALDTASDREVHDDKES